MSTTTNESLEDFHNRLDGSAITTYVLVMLFVPLKLWCRMRSGGWRNLGLDDALTVLALLVANAFFYVCMFGMRKLLGLHVTEVLATSTGYADLTSFLKYVFAGQIFYLLGIAVVKFSIIAFYWRLFAITARIPIFIMAGIVFSWLMSLLFLVIFTCSPVAASWDVTLQANAKCIALKSIYLGGSIPNVITDGVLILMPIPYVWRLHAPVAQRLIIASMFCLGIFIAIVSIIRLNIFMSIDIATMSDVTYNFREVIVWSIVEVNVGLVCACLPSLKPALTLIGLNRLFSFNNSRPSNAQSPGPSGTPLSYGRSGGGSRRPARKKGSTGGLFSSIAGITKLDDESEEYQLTVTPSTHGKSGAEVHTQARASTDNDSRGSRGSGVGGHEGGFSGIHIKRDWRVSVDERSNCGRR